MLHHISKHLEARQNVMFSAMLLVFGNVVQHGLIYILFDILHTEFRLKLVLLSWHIIDTYHNQVNVISTHSTYTLEIF